MMNLSLHGKILAGINILLALVILILIVVDNEKLPRGDFNFSNTAVGEKENDIPAQKSVDFAVMSDKALFHQSRRKIERSIVVTPKATAKKSISINAILLKGIVFDQNGESVAYLINSSSNKKYQLKLYDGFEGWQVKEIARNSIKLEKEGQQTTLKLIK